MPLLEFELRYSRLAQLSHNAVGGTRNTVRFTASRPTGTAWEEIVYLGINPFVQLSFTLESRVA
jgi:hypothetical protein